MEPTSELIVVVIGCTSGRWLLKVSGMMVWREAGAKSEVGRCFTSIRSNEKIVMKPCEEFDENQYVEFGEYIGSELLPQCIECWRERQERLRSTELLEYRKIVTKTLTDIADTEVENLGVANQGERRAVVFYVDKKQAISYLKWWLRAWRFIGLDHARESFDIIVMAEPDIVADLPIDCQEYTRQFNV